MVFNLEGDAFLKDSKTDPIDIQPEIDYIDGKLHEKYPTEPQYKNALIAFYKRLCIEGRDIKKLMSDQSDHRLNLGGIVIQSGPTSDPDNGYVNFTRACAAAAVLCWNTKVLPTTVKSSLSHQTGCKMITATGVNLMALIVPGMQYVREKLNNPPEERFFLEACLALDTANHLKSPNAEMSTVGAWQRHYPALDPENWPKELDASRWEPTAVKGSEKVRQAQKKCMEVAEKYKAAAGYTMVNGKYVKTGPGTSAGGSNTTV